MQKFLGALLLALALVAGACGGDDSDGPGDDGANNGGTVTESPAAGRDGRSSASDFHACDLFTADEISEIFGDQAGEGEDYLAVAADATACSWNFVFIEVLLEDGPDWYDAVHLADDDSDVEEVGGLGDTAAWDTFLRTLDVVDGDRYLSVQPIVGFLDLDAREVAIELAEIALERLP